MKRTLLDEMYNVNLDGLEEVEIDEAVSDKPKVKLTEAQIADFKSVVGQLDYTELHGAIIEQCENFINKTYKKLAGYELEEDRDYKKLSNIVMGDLADYLQKSGIFEAIVEAKKKRVAKNKAKGGTILKIKDKVKVDV